MRNRTLGLLTLVSCLSFIFFSGPSAYSADKPYIAVGSAKARKVVLAIAPIRSEARAGSEAEIIRDTLSSDLTFMDLFRFLGTTSFIEPVSAGIAPGSFKMTDWSSIGAEFVIKARVGHEAGTLKLEGHLYDTAGNRVVLSKRYVAGNGEPKILAHSFANDIVTALTGLPGIFLTKIVMSCGQNGKKDLFLMNFDGTDVRRLTRHNSIAFAPAWHPDGAKIAYSVYTKNSANVRNIDLYEMDFRDRTVRLVSNRKGINSGASYSPDGRRIAATLSFSGNPEIYVFTATGQSATRITQSFGFDVDPTWSPDGTKLAFVSSRSGMPMVYSMNADGSNVQRLTFAGRYNATPTWSPTNNKIGFAGWIDGRFDIFIMNPDGTTIERLTKNQGNNEDPSFSPDGNFIAFSSNRTGQSNIYVMNVDGTFTKRLTYGLGNCSMPKWSLITR
ncbi:Tol-Pal system beta propeller repeat protein TolB [bacterium]|nr:Tol-Pal system beta propeller repeat protein TolB [bacterium]